MYQDRRLYAVLFGSLAKVICIKQMLWLWFYFHYYFIAIMQ
ncbi:hypothetical protein SALWKB12_2172 [Snodgrassella communis]|uniref:Uncharacterized protein n=1 Tax=Snodgrassella communis TaxID=2946699 RepID=A0A836MNW6_9NEIS|nr:hypothetical protein SALWKB12_2172 [Snodgrassella communis]KDN14296.1 hypothetical protein SALWKB29_1598 [Snodgrassella communis]